MMVLRRLLGPRREPPASLESRPSAPRPRCSLVITSFEGIENLKAYLPLNLMHVTKDGPCDEVIVVDDGSRDGSVEYLWRNHSTVRVVPLLENRGFGHAANAGFRAARNDLVVNISNDMVLTGYFFDLLLSNFVLDDVFMVGARLVGSDGRLQRGRTVPFYMGDFRTWKVFSHEPDPTPGPARRLYHQAWSAIGMYNRRIFLELGGFDALFLPVYAEENDLCYRAWRRGYRVLYEPRAWVMHYHEESGTIERTYDLDTRKVQYRRNRLIFVWKNVTSPLLLVAHLLYVAAAAAVSWLGPRQIFYRGLREALTKLGEVRRSRAQERLLFVRTDWEVLSEVGRAIERPAPPAPLPAPLADPPGPTAPGAGQTPPLQT